VTGAVFHAIVVQPGGHIEPLAYGTHTALQLRQLPLLFTPGMGTIEPVSYPLRRRLERCSHYSALSAAFGSTRAPRMAGRARDDGDEEQRRGHRSKDNGIAGRVTVMYAVPGISFCKRRRSGSMKRRA
jgi:hypothetical protein